MFTTYCRKLWGSVYVCNVGLKLRYSKVDGAREGERGAGGLVVDPADGRSSAQEPRKRRQLQLLFRLTFDASVPKMIGRGRARMP